MPRHNQPKKRLIIRFKDHTGLPKSSLVFSANSKSAKKNFGGGKVLRIGKMSEEQQHKVGDYNDLPKRLMEEFRKENYKRPEQLNTGIHTPKIVNPT